MKTPLFRFVLCLMVSCLSYITSSQTVAAPLPSAEDFCGVIDYKLDNRNYARSLTANLNVGEPRTVRMIYFLPNDRLYREDVVQRMKDEILDIQDFYAESMKAHGYEGMTFKIEMDSQGEPMVHRVDGQHPDSHYINKSRGKINAYVFDQITKVFDTRANIYFVVIDKSKGEVALASPGRKNGGYFLVISNFKWKTLAHELGHAFDLHHNFNDGAYIMSYGYPEYETAERYGPGQNQLSACSAKFLTSHPYFNVNVQLEDTPPTIELISPLIYPTGSKSVPIKLKVSDSEGLHQAILYVITSRNLHPARGVPEIKTWRSLSGEKTAIVEFDYDGVMPTDDLTNLSTPRRHRIIIEVVDINGNVGQIQFALEENTPPETITLQQDMEIEVHIPDSYLRERIYKVLGYFIGKSKSKPITRRDMKAITTFAPSGFVDTMNIVNDLTGLEFATNLRKLWLDSNRITDVLALSDLPHLKYLNLDKNNITDVSALVPGLSGLNDLELHLSRNSISDISSMAGLTNLRILYLWRNNISDISAVANMINLTRLYLRDNNISDISAVAGLTNLKWLRLGHNSVSDISAVAGLTNLKGLGLGNNSISDISALTELTDLKGLWLLNNSISDISDISGLTELMWLDLRRNLVSDVSVLTGLTNLTQLRLDRNNISDISALAGLTLLEELELKENNISDISALVELTHLKRLRLGHNSVSDISPLANLTRLESLKLAGNNVSDISVLAGLTNINTLDLSYNNVSNISVLTHLIFLNDLRIVGNSISDISHLVESIGDRDMNLIDLRSNPLSYKSLHTYIPILQEKGIYVLFDADRIPPTDINQDGTVNILDLIQVANNLGKYHRPTDVNRDGTVDIVDLVMVASEFEDVMAAPSLSLQYMEKSLQYMENIAATDIQQWIDEAKVIRLNDITIERGIAVLEHLMELLMLTETNLLPNYPNPFNPETWIPFRLAEDANVTLAIYDVDGRIVRRLDIGYSRAGIYEGRDKAIYWDGRNDLGESIASGVYFYHLMAGEYSATRRMAILK